MSRIRAVEGDECERAEAAGRGSDFLLRLACQCVRLCEERDACQCHRERRERSRRAPMAYGAWCYFVVMMLFMCVCVCVCAYGVAYPYVVCLCGAAGKYCDMCLVWTREYSAIVMMSCVQK